MSYFNQNDCIALSTCLAMDSQMESSSNIDPFEPFYCVSIKSNLLDCSK